MKKYIYFNLLAILLLILLGCRSLPDSSDEGYEPVTLKMNYALVINYAPIIIAEEEGYFADYGITLEKVTFNSSVEAVPLVVGGQLDVYAGASSAGILNVLGKEENIKVVADRGHISPEGCSFQAILVRKDLYESGEITTGEDLAGRVISTPPTGPGIYFLSHYLEQAGLSLDDVETTDTPRSTYIDSFRNKTVDAIVATELHLSRLLADGNASILVGSEEVVGYYQTSLLAFGKNLLVNNPDIGVRFLAAYLKGVEIYNKGKTESNLNIISEATGESVELLKNSCWLDINQDGRIDFSAIDSFQQWSVEMGYMERMITEEQFWTPSFLEEASSLLNSE